MSNITYNQRHIDELNKNRIYCTYEQFKKIFPTDATHKTAGVYFLMKDGNVQYIGESKNIGERLRQHKGKDYDRFTFTVIKDDYIRRKIEAVFIAEHDPPFNGKDEREFLEEITPYDSMANMARVGVNLSSILIGLFIGAMWGMVGMTGIFLFTCFFTPYMIPLEYFQYAGIAIAIIAAIRMTRYMKNHGKKIYKFEPLTPNQ